MAKKSNPALNELLAVVTVPEAADRWHVSMNAVYAAIDRGKLDAKQYCKMWLVTVESLERYWGKGDPPNVELCVLSIPKWRRVA